MVAFEGIDMPAAHDCFQLRHRHIRRFAGRVSAAHDTVHARLGRLATTDPRVTATTTLLGVIIIVAAMLAFPLPVAGIGKQVTSAGISKAEEAPASIKFIGAKPRGASCEDQVWPYIERHCLRRAADTASSAGPGPSSRNSGENPKQRGTTQ
jgi:hypothetical protein